MILLHALPLVALGQTIIGTTKNFKELVLDSPHVVMVEFYAPWCGHCKALDPEYKKAASKLRGLAKLVQVDCDNSLNKELCGRYGVKGFPTVKIFPSGSKGSPTDYQGERTSQAIVSTVIPMIPGKHVHKISSTSEKKSHHIEEFRKKEEGNVAKVLLITDKKTTPPLFKALSLEYQNRLIFGEIKKSDVATLSILNVTKTPMVLVITKEGETISYDGIIKQDPLIEFLNLYALASDKKSEKVKKVSKQKVSINPIVEELNCSDCLSKKCLGQEGVCLIAFLTLEKEFPESVAAHSSNINMLQAVKRKFEGRTVPVHVVWVNAIEHGHQLIKDFSVSDMYPSMIAFDAAKKQYGLLRLSFEESSINNFVDSFLSGYKRIQYSIIPVLDKSKKEMKKEEVKKNAEKGDKKEKPHPEL